MGKQTSNSQPSPGSGMHALSVPLFSSAAADVAKGRRSFLAGVNRHHCLYGMEIKASSLRWKATAASLASACLIMLLRLFPRCGKPLSFRSPENSFSFTPFHSMRIQIHSPGGYVRPVLQCRLQSFVIQRRGRCFGEFAYLSHGIVEQVFFRYQVGPGFHPSVHVRGRAWRRQVPG